MKLEDLLPEEINLRVLLQAKRFGVMNPNLVKITPLKTLKKIYPDLPEAYILKVKLDYQK